MSATVLARLSTPRRLVIDSPFPFYGLPTFLRSLSPLRIDVGFRRSSAQDSAVDLALTFNEASASDSIVLFKETLIRSEADLDFDCVFFRDTADQFEEAGWTCVEIQPDVLALPSGKEIAVTMPLLDVAVDLLRQAHIMDAELSYRATLERANPAPESARALVPALAELHGGRSIAGLEEAVREGFDLLRFGGWSARERICIPQGRAGLDQPWIESLIRQHLGVSVGFLRDELWSLRWDAAQSHRDKGVLQETVARLRNADFLDRLFHRVVPSDASQYVITKSLDEARRVRRDTVRGDYAFISYAHTNAEFVKALLRELNTVGVRCWYDINIGAGSRWDEELEDRIRNAGVLIACMSDDYQESKYCKRELKFADLLDKTILPIAPSRWTWGPGLQMMFQELQVAFFDGGRGFTDFRRTLESVAPQVFHS